MEWHGLEPPSGGYDRARRRWRTRMWVEWATGSLPVWVAWASGGLPGRERPGCPRLP